MKWNDIKDPDKIVVVQVIRLTDPALTHVVVAGDTLTKLAATHKVTVEDLVRWNEIRDPNTIVVGQELKLTAPPAPPAPGAGAGEQVYVVKAGDTVSELAQKFKLRWVDIAAVNKLADMDLIYVGHKLIIPAQSVARGPVPPPPAEADHRVPFCSHVARAGKRERRARHTMCGRTTGQGGPETAASDGSKVPHFRFCRQRPRIPRPNRARTAPPSEHPASWRGATQSGAGRRDPDCRPRSSRPVRGSAQGAGADGARHHVTLADRAYPHGEGVR